MSVRFLRRALIAVLLFTLILTLLFAYVVAAPLSAETVKFDDTDVLTDLTTSKSGSNGGKFNLSDHPYDNTGTGSMQLINFVEYCYSPVGNKRGNYGLYIYIYNPAGYNVEVTSALNCVQLAVSYDDRGLPTVYEKFALKFCSKSKGEYLNLFYKFKILDHRSGDGFKIADRVNKTSRRYDISGFELKADGAVKDFGVGGTYVFTGYAEGYGGSTAAAPLTCSVTDLVTLRLDLRDHFITYRTGVSSAGKGHQNQVDSVYFSVPRKILDKYGRLQKINAEWYEYKTTPIIVTDSQADYDKLKPYVGRALYDSAGKPIYDKDNVVPLGVKVGGLLHKVYDWGVFLEPWLSSDGNSSVTVNDKAQSFQWLLKKDDFSTNGVPSSVLDEYIKSYPHSVNGTVYDGMSADLFLPTVDDGRTFGYNNKTFDADAVDDKFDLLSYDSNHSGFTKFFSYWGNSLDLNTDEAHYGVSPFELITTADLADPTRLLINASDVSRLTTYIGAETIKGNDVFLFRFANTDYYSAELTGGSGNSYMTYETIFKGFDILSLTFNKEGDYFTIPVVSDPIDVVPGLTPPLEGKSIFDIIAEWFAKLSESVQKMIKVAGIVVGAILILIALWIVIKVLGVVWTIVSAPFKGIGKIKNRKKKD